MGLQCEWKLIEYSLLFHFMLQKQTFGSKTTFSFHFISQCGNKKKEKEWKQFKVRMNERRPTEWNCRCKPKVTLKNTNLPFWGVVSVESKLWRTASRMSWLRLRLRRMRPAATLPMRPWRRLFTPLHRLSFSRRSNEVECLSVDQLVVGIRDIYADMGKKEERAGNGLSLYLYLSCCSICVCVDGKKR